MMTETSDGTLALPAPAALVEFLLDAANEFEADVEVAPTSSGTVPLSSYVRFRRRMGHRRGVLSVDVRADGSVYLTRLGARCWRTVFASPGNRLSAAHVPAPVILAAIRAAIEEG